VKNEVEAYGRGIAAAPKYAIQARRNENADPFAHQKAAAQWGREIGNPRAAGVLRTAGEMAQLPYYVGKDIASYAATGKPDKYHALNGPAYFRDAHNDIRNSIEGAKGASPYLKR
jgi:hypothetical protein